MLPCWVLSPPCCPEVSEVSTGPRCTGPKPWAQHGSSSQLLPAEGAEMDSNIVEVWLGSSSKGFADCGGGGGGSRRQVV